MKIPEGYSIDTIESAMQILQVDPNFQCLVQVVVENDLALLQKQLKSGIDEHGKELDDAGTKKTRYKIQVFEDFIAMPTILIESIKRSRIQPEEEERLDPYATEEDLNSGEK